MLYKYQVATSRKQEFINIDAYIYDALTKSEVKSGIAVVFCPHTTAGITINENADPNVKKDLELGLNKAFPNDSGKWPMGSEVRARHCR